MSEIAMELSSGWQFREADNQSQDEWLPVRKVPTVVHLDLQDCGRIPDPFLDINELASRWVAEKSWRYRTTFNTPNAQADGSRTDLVFKGLDTFATVTLNGHEILRADNMFREYRVDATDHLLKTTTSESTPRANVNVLEIVFDSALLRGRDLVKQHEHEHDFISHQTESSRLPVRKAQCHWGWDWGPILITAGPWKPILLETYVVRVDGVWWQGQVSEDLKSVKGKFLATTDASGKQDLAGATVTFELSLDGNVVFQSQSSTDDAGAAAVDFTLESPALWYPHGYGKQTLYQLKVAIVSSGQSKQTASKVKSIGFRRCQLVQEPDEHGKSFYFRINNVDVFAGGSCWIPADSFLPRIGEDGYKKWMELMIEGNQIMTRIWGGGIYEDDAFYSACDELGILVWQDFAFACASYPTYPSFLAQIETEARENIRRLRSHPSLTIWAGNNEDYQIQEQHKLEYDYDGDKDPQHWLKTTFPARYIYEYLLPKVVGEEDPGAVYHPSSPWGDGKKTWDPTVGDIHQWNVWHASMRRYQELPSMGGRFVSEFGMEAYPHLSTIKSFNTNASQRYPGSMTMDYHNRATDHERRLMTYVMENFRVPRLSAAENEDIEAPLASFGHITQIVQADAMHFAYRSWRRDWSTTTGSRKCGGVLVWQFNDTWPTISWAVADYYLVPKPGFYAIKRALQPLVVGVSRPFHEWTTGHCDPTIAVRERSFDLWISSLSNSGMSGGTDGKVSVVLRVISIKQGKDLVPEMRWDNVRVGENGTTEIVKGGKVAASASSSREGEVSDDSDRTPFNPVSGWDPYILHARLVLNGTTIATDTAWPHPIKYLDFSDRGVRVEVASSSSSEAKPSKVIASINISATKPVHGFVFEESRDQAWRLSDNGFDVVPGETVVVDLTAKEPKEKAYVAEKGQNVLRWRYIESEGVGETRF